MYTTPKNTRLLDNSKTKHPLRKGAVKLRYSLHYSSSFMGARPCNITAAPSCAIAPAASTTKAVATSAIVPLRIHWNGNKATREHDCTGCNYHWYSNTDTERHLTCCKKEIESKY
jgi:hypothetical protein